MILGPSGSGKSTLLNMLGGLDCLDSGEIMVGDIRVVKDISGEDALDTDCLIDELGLKNMPPLFRQNFPAVSCRDAP